MAKVPFSKLNTNKKIESKVIAFNDLEIEVKQYLPINEKLELIGKVIDLAKDNNNFINVVKLNVLTRLELVEYYTNISFTEKQKEDLNKLYDTIYQNDLLTEVLSNIPETEISLISHGVKETSESIYKYEQSFLGILDNISKDYSNLEFDAKELNKELSNPEHLALLKDVVTKLG